MKLNPKTVYKFAKIVAKEGHVREVLKKVLITPTKMVATDSYCLLEVEQENDTKTNQLLDFAEFQNTYKKQDKEIEIETTNENGEIMGAKFPDYERAMPKENPIATTYLDADCLIKVLEQFRDRNKNDVEIELYGEDRPILLKKEGMRGLVMPLKR